MSGDSATLGDWIAALAYQDAASAAWEADPRAAFERFGLPCWCGLFGCGGRCADTDSGREEVSE